MTVRLWDVDTGEYIHILQGHIRSVTSVVYSPNGNRIASGSYDETVRLWDVDTGECAHVLQGHDDWIKSIAYSPKGGWIASGSNDRAVRLWNTKTGQCEIIISDFNGYVNGLALRGESSSLFLVTGSRDKSVRHWKITKKGGEYKLTLCWSSSYEVLAVADASFKGVQGLSPLNRKLLIQRNALVSAPPLTEMQVVEV
ncbi:hypothetical protein BGZ46_003888 [Entomortierella lignicola]|nr:hypothetical protein BGZ46_003888 [Entomortierella lignicola]